MQFKGSNVSLNQQCSNSGGFSRSAFSFKVNQSSGVLFDHWRQLIFGLQIMFMLNYSFFSPSLAPGFPVEHSTQCACHGVCDCVINVMVDRSD